MASSNTVGRFVPKHTDGVSHLTPILVALALLAASAVLAVVISGPIR